MIPMGVREKIRKRKRTISFFILAVSGAIIGLFLLLFALVNNVWVVVNIPSAPWSTTPPTPLFEARLFAIMGVSFAVGILLTVLIFLVTRKNNAQTNMEQELRIKELEQELSSIHRLLAITRERR